MGICRIAGRADSQSVQRRDLEAMRSSLALGTDPGESSHNPESRMPQEEIPPAVIQKVEL